MAQDRQQLDDEVAALLKARGKIDGKLEAARERRTNWRDDDEERKSKQIKRKARRETEEEGVNHRVQDRLRKNPDRTRAEGYAQSCPCYPMKCIGVTRGRAGKVKEVKAREKDEMKSDKQEGGQTSNGFTT